MQFTTYTVLALAAAVSAKQIPVSVGDGALAYSPNDFTADIGDEIVFSYFPKNHTVTQSSFAKPCVPLAGGFFSGFVPTASGVAKTTFSIKVTTKDPIWFYCSQPVLSHCKAGMVGGININQQSKNTLAAFKTLAAATNGSITDLVPAGGAVSSNVAVPPPSNSNSTSASASASTSASVSKSTTVISTAVTTTAASAYTTNGVAYTSGQAVTYTTVYSTAVAATGTGSASATPVQVSVGAAPTSLTGGLFAGAAAVLGAMALI